GVLGPWSLVVGPEPALGSWLLALGASAISSCSAMVSLLMKIHICLRRTTDDIRRVYRPTNAEQRTTVLPTTKDQRPITRSHTSFPIFFSSRYLTTLPTSCAFSRVVTS